MVRQKRCAETPSEIANVKILLVSLRLRHNQKELALSLVANPGCFEMAQETLRPSVTMNPISANWNVFLLFAWKRMVGNV